MALAYLGALCWDEAAAALNTREPVSEVKGTTPLTDVGSIVQPTAVETNLFSRWSNGSASSGGGGNSCTLFQASTQDFAFYMSTWAFLPGSGGLGTKHRILYTDPDGPGTGGVGPTTGTIALGTEIHTTSGFTRIKFRFLWYDGAAWQEGALTTNGYSSLLANIYVLMQIDKATKQLKMWVNGVADTGADATASVTPITNTPAVSCDIYAGVTFFSTGRSHELIMADGSAAADKPTYASALTNPHVYAYYPLTIGDSNAWTAVGVCDNGGAQKWRAVRDPMYDAYFVEDYIHATGIGANVDQLFGIDFVAADFPSAAILGVYVAVGLGTSGLKASSILTKQGGTTVVQTANPAGTDGNWKYYFYALAPDGGAWTAAKLEALQVGVRNSHASEVQRANVIVVGVIGTNIGRPGLPAKCPSLAVPHPVQRNVLLRR